MSPRSAYNRRNRAWQPTERQREVLDLLVEAKTNAEIAVRLDITVDGAKWHVGELLSETGCNDRQALASWWRRERGRKPGFVLLPWFRLRPAVAGGVVMGAGLLAVMFAIALMTGDREGRETADAQRPSPTPWAPTPWPDEALEALAASQGPPPATCEPPEAQDLRLVDAAELAAEGLEPAGRVLISGHCPLYVANRVDRSVVWAGGSSVLSLPEQDGWRLANIIQCCNYSSTLRDDYYFTADNYPSPGGPARLWDTFDFVDSWTAIVHPVHGEGTYLMLQVREVRAVVGPSLGASHRVALASDGQLFIDPEPVSGDIVTNGLTGETIDVSDFGPGMPLSVEVATGAVRTDCWAEDGVCRVYLDGVRGAREGDVGVFNPSTLLAPFDGVLSCVADEEGAWNIDGPALAHELSNGPLTLRIGAFGGAGEEWEDCQPRDVRRGQAFPVWTYTYIEALVGGEPRSIVSTRDGRLFVGDVELELGCPCEGRN